MLCKMSFMEMFRLLGNWMFNQKIMILILSYCNSKNILIAETKTFDYYLYYYFLIFYIYF